MWLIWRSLEVAAAYSNFKIKCRVCEIRSKNNNSIQIIICDLNFDLTIEKMYELDYVHPNQVPDVVLEELRCFLKEILKVIV